MLDMILGTLFLALVALGVYYTGWILERAAKGLKRSGDRAPITMEVVAVLAFVVLFAVVTVDNYPDPGWWIPGGFAVVMLTTLILGSRGK